MELTDKTAVITGGASGIGKAIARKFTEEGATVHILDINQAKGTELAQTLKNSGRLAEFHECDVADRKITEQVILGILQQNSVDILVNNAGVSHIGNIEQTSDEDLDRLIGINIKGLIHCTRVIITEMRKKNGGVILNIASVAASVGLNDRFAYSMTKGAVVTMTYSLARDYIDFNIRCNSISPARIHTPFVDGFLKMNYPGHEQEMYEKLAKTQPIGRMGTPEEVADLACYLCSDKASFITGTDYPIDGGFIKLNT